MKKIFFYALATPFLFSFSLTPVSALTSKPAHLAQKSPTNIKEAKIALNPSANLTREARQPLARDTSSSRIKEELVTASPEREKPATGKTARIATLPGTGLRNATGYLAPKTLLPGLERGLGNRFSMGHGTDSTLSPESFVMETNKKEKENLFVGHARAPVKSTESALGMRGDIFRANIGWDDDLRNTKRPPEAFEKVSLDSSISKTPGVDIQLGAQFQAFSLSSSYSQAMDLSDYNSLLSKEQNSVARIWNNELAYTTDWMARELVFAFGYQKTTESDTLDLPGERYRTRASLFLSKDTSVSLEYYHDNDTTHKDKNETEEDGVLARFGFTF